MEIENLITSKIARRFEDLATENGNTKKFLLGSS